MNYSKPEVLDYGTVHDLTENCFGTGAQDELGKTFDQPARTTPIVGPSDPCGLP
jgi:hypothetical protein